MYSKIKSSIRTEEGSSDLLHLTTGLMQDECLSFAISLFSIYINCIVEVMDNVPDMGLIVGETKVTVLKWWLMLMSSNLQGL